jgi:hypothetical protein
MNWTLWSFSTINRPGSVGALTCPLPELLSREQLTLPSAILIPASRAAVFTTPIPAST